MKPFDPREYFTPLSRLKPCVPIKLPCRPIKLPCIPIIKPCVPVDGFDPQKLYLYEDVEYYFDDLDIDILDEVLADFDLEKDLSISRTTKDGSYEIMTIEAYLRKYWNTNGIRKTDAEVDKFFLESPFDISEYPELAQAEKSNSIFAKKWDIKRLGKARATCVALGAPDIVNLANEIHLDPAQALGEKGWLRDKRGKALPKETKIIPGEIYTVPNTVIAYWGGELGSLGRWWVDWGYNVERLKNKKYLVLEIKGSSKTKNREYQKLLHKYAMISELHGTYFWGHGNKFGLAFEETKKTLLVYKELKLSYKIAFAHIYACESNSGKSAFDSIKWTGFSGILYPINPWDSDWENPSKP